MRVMLPVELLLHRMVLCEEQVCEEGFCFAQPSAKDDENEAAA
jgi:hypothetical protein